MPADSNSLRTLEHVGAGVSLPGSAQRPCPPADVPGSPLYRPSLLLSSARALAVPPGTWLFQPPKDVKRLSLPLPSRHCTFGHNLITVSQRGYWSCFTDHETEAQRGYITCQELWTVELGEDSRTPNASCMT